jgi:hypothetical protein
MMGDAQHAVSPALVPEQVDAGDAGDPARQVPARSLEISDHDLDAFIVAIPRRAEERVVAFLGLCPQLRVVDLQGRAPADVPPGEGGQLIGPLVAVELQVLTGGRPHEPVFARGRGNGKHGAPRPAHDSGSRASYEEPVDQACTATAGDDQVGLDRLRELENLA